MLRSWSPFWSLHVQATLFWLVSANLFSIRQVMLYNHTDSENLYTEAKALSDQVSKNSSSLNLLKESLQQKCSPSGLEGECQRAAVETALQKICQSIELQYITMQKRHANIQKKASKHVPWNIASANIVLWSMQICYTHITHGICIHRFKQRANPVTPGN